MLAIGLRFRTILSALSALLTLGALPCAAHAQTVTPSLPRVVLQDDEPGAVAALLEQVPSIASDVAARIVLTQAAADSSLDGRLAAFEARRVPLWLSIPAPADESGLETWRTAVRVLLDRRHSTLEVLEVTVDQQPARVAAFAVQLAATEVHARRPAATRAGC